MVPRNVPAVPPFAMPAAVITLPVVPTINRIAGGQFELNKAKVRPIEWPDFRVTTVPYVRFFTSREVLSITPLAFLATLNVLS